jgi:hypothetical protein
MEKRGGETPHILNIDSGRWASRSDHFIRLPREGLQVPTGYWAGWTPELVLWMWSLPLSWIEPKVVQPNGTLLTSMANYVSVTVPFTELYSDEQVTKSVQVAQCSVTWQTSSLLRASTCAMCWGYVWKEVRTLYSTSGVSCRHVFRPICGYRNLQLICLCKTTTDDVILIKLQL